MQDFFANCATVLQKYGFSYLRGAGTTLLLALVGTFFGCLIGFAVGALQTIPVDKQRDRMGAGVMPARTCIGKGMFFGVRLLPVCLHGRFRYLEYLAVSFASVLPCLIMLNRYPFIISVSFQIV